MYDVGPPSASCVGLVSDVGLVEVPACVVRPFELLEASEVASGVREGRCSLLRPDADSAVNLSGSGWVGVWSSFLAWPLLPPRMPFHRGLPLESGAVIAMQPAQTTKPIDRQ